MHLAETAISPVTRLPYGKINNAKAIYKQLLHRRASMVLVAAAAQLTCPDSSDHG
jgi:hypothetical protein